MKKTNITVIALVLALSTLVLAEETTKSPNEPASENAAIKYKKAFNLLPKLSPKEQELICCGKVRAVPLNAAVLNIVQKSKPALEMVLVGAKCGHCDWGLGTQSRMQSLLDLMGKVRQASDFTILQIRHHIQQQQSKEGVELFLASLTMNRHFAANGPVISYLVQISAEMQAVQTVADNLASLDKASMQALAKGLEKLPQRASLSDAILRGQDFVDQVVKNQPHYQTAVEFQEDVAKIADLPPDDFERKLSAIDNFWQGNLGPGYIRVNQEQARGKSKMAMLKAAIVLILEGEEKFKAIKDSYGDGPFEYKKLGNGFELGSELKVKDKPVTLTIGGSQ